MPTTPDMSVQIGHLSLVHPAVGPVAADAGAPRRATAPAGSPPVTADVVSSTPPDEVLDGVADAAQRAQDFADRNRELHFAKDPSSGRIVVQVRDLDGNVLRTIPPSEALDVMSGLGEP